MFSAKINISVFEFAGTEEERGIRKWRNIDTETSPTSDLTTDVYSIYFIQKYLDKVSAFRFIPFCPSFTMNQKRPSQSDIGSPKPENFPQQEVGPYNTEATENTKL